MNPVALLSFSLRLIFKAVAIFLGFFSGFFLFKLAEFFPALKTSLRSVIFQVALSLLALYVTASERNLLVSVFLLTALGKSFYDQYRDYREDRLWEWFWSLRETPSRAGLIGYFLVVGFIFFYSFSNLIF